MGFYLQCGFNKQTDWNNKAPLPLARLQPELIKARRLHVNQQLAERGWADLIDTGLIEASLRLLIKEYTQAGYVVQKQGYRITQIHQTYFVGVRPARPTSSKDTPWTIVTGDEEVSLDSL